MLYPSRPTLTQTETEFLLYIHPQAKERAKVIRGYRWDPERRCWVYPRTQPVLDALVAEFGEELARTGGRRPTAAPPAPPGEALERRIAELEGQNAELRRALEETVSASVDADLEQSDLHIQLEEARAGLARARALSEAQREELTRRLEELDADLARSREELAGARASLGDLQAALMERTRGSALEVQLKKMALEATGNDATFAPVLDTLDLSTNLPLKAARLLEDQLRLLLNLPPGDRSADLYDLIQQVGEYELLPRDAVDMAHLIRRQRNVIAHAEAYEKTYQARSVLCLFAVALLWPDLPE